MFFELITDIATHVNGSGEYAVQFATDGVFPLVFLRFWRAEFLKRTSRLRGQTSAEICLLSYLMGVISTKPILLSSTGCSALTIELVDRSPYSPHGVQSPPRFEELRLQSLMHKKSSCFFGKINFFSELKYLIVSLGGCVKLDWVLLSPELSRVSIVLY